MGVGMDNDGSIHRCSLTGQDDVTIVPAGITHTPKQMIIAGASEKMYWSDREGMRVMRSSLDGRPKCLSKREAQQKRKETLRIGVWVLQWMRREI